MTVRKLTVDEGALEIVHLSDGRIPKRGAAIRPDHKGRPILHEDGKPLGLVVKEWDVVDYTAPSGRVAFIEVDYTPGVPA